jgi:hypothetical protein
VDQDLELLVRNVRFVVSFVLSALFLFPSAAQRASLPLAQCFSQALSSRPVPLRPSNGNRASGPYIKISALQISSAAAGQAPSSQSSSLASPGNKDAQAIAVLNKALSTMGGQSAIQRIDDYTAIGHITYHFAEDQKGTTTIRGRVFNDLRLDATLSGGIRSETTSQGLVSLKGEDGTVSQISSSPPVAASRMILPYLLLAVVGGSSGYSISYEGVVEVGNSSAHYIRIQRQIIGLDDPDGNLSEVLTSSYWIDASTFQILMMRDTLSKQNVRTIRYSDYRLVGGIWVPFSIEQEGGYQACSIQLDQITFNSGLLDSDFQF